jgi:IS605 OrfB family transposase
MTGIICVLLIGLPIYTPITTYLINIQGFPYWIVLWKEFLSVLLVGLLFVDILLYIIGIYNQHNKEINAQLVRLAFEGLAYDKILTNPDDIIGIESDIVIGAGYLPGHSTDTDAVMVAQGLHARHGDKKVIFGGRKLWEQLQSQLILREEWASKRDGQIYARGDRTKSGNPNLRVVGDKLRVTVGTKKFASYKLFISSKFKSEMDRIISSGESYNVRLIRTDAKHWKVVVDYSVEEPLPVIGFQNGSIGIDTNPDRIAIANVSNDGNLIEAKSLVNNRLYHASQNKREYDIGCMVKQVIEYAKQHGKGIVFEDLNFQREYKEGQKRWNRTKSNFVWRKFITLLERKCVQHGIEYKKANPAFTSVIGKLKYRVMYGLSVHESAAYVIGRRGLGLNEKLSLHKQPRTRVKEAVCRHLEGKTNKRVHSWQMWRCLRDNKKAILTGFKSSMSKLEDLGDSLFDGSESLSGEVFLQQLLAGSKNVSFSGG